MLFFPTESTVFPLTTQLAATVLEASKLFVTLTNRDNKTQPKLTLTIQKLEKKADELAHVLRYEANAAFITPFDREDVHALAKSLYSIIDHIENIASILRLSKNKKDLILCQPYAHLTQESTTLLSEALTALTARRVDTHLIHTHIHTVHALWKKSQQMYRENLLSLFEKKSVAPHAQKTIYIIQNCHDILCACEEASDVIDDIVIKSF